MDADRAHNREDDGRGDAPGNGRGDAGCVWRDLPEGRALRIEVASAARSQCSPAGDSNNESARRSEEIESAWARIRAANPRAFNGPILVYESADPEAGLVRARRGEYKHLAVRPAIDTGVVQLGVTGVLEARDATGVPHALLGLRSDATRVFGGMWEFGPSGGVDPPPTEQSTMDADDLWRVLINEIREEVGLPVDPDPTPPVALLEDPSGQSVELIVRVNLRRPVEELIALIEAENRTSRWEYDAVRWVPFSALGAFVRTEPSIPSAVALAARLAPAK